MFSDTSLPRAAQQHQQHQQNKMARQHQQHNTLTDITDRLTQLHDSSLKDLFETINGHKSALHDLVQQARAELTALSAAGRGPPDTQQVCATYTAPPSQTQACPCVSQDHQVLTFQPLPLQDTCTQVQAQQRERTTAATEATDATTATGEGGNMCLLLLLHIQRVTSRETHTSTVATAIQVQTLANNRRCDLPCCNLPSTAQHSCAEMPATDVAVFHLEQVQQKQLLQPQDGSSGGSQPAAPQQQQLRPLLQSAAGAGRARQHPSQQLRSKRQARAASSSSRSSMTTMINKQRPLVMAAANQSIPCL